MAIEWGLRGFNVTVTQRESSALTAAMYASSQLVKGSADAALIGGVDEANEMLFSVLDRLGALAHEDEGVDEAARPFDVRRNGLVIGEGSAMLVAGAAGRKPYGWLTGFGMARDTTATVSNWGERPESVVTAMKAAIDDAELSIEDIDAVYASANSTRRGDRLEQQAIESLFGASVPVVATKGICGEYAAGGALQLAAALLAVESQSIHASVGFERADETSGIQVSGERRDMPLRHVLVNSLSAGGGIVTAIVSREAL